MNQQPRFRQAVTIVLATLLGVVGCAPGIQVSPGPSTAPTGTGPSPSPTASAFPSFQRPTATPAPTALSYMVRSGDNLTSIARQFATSARSIAFWNRDRYPSLDPQSSAYDPNRVGVGWRLTIIPSTVVDESQLPSPSPAAPTATPPAPPTAPSAEPSIGPSALISHGSRSSKGVALTFDMGGRLDPALQIMDWLIANEVHATIFPTGKTVAETPIGRAVVERVAAHPDLFILGNHTWDHPDLTELDAAAVADQLVRTEAAARDLAGLSTKPFFRPPFGSQNVAVRNTVGAVGWSKTVMWDVDTIDWRPTSDGGPTAVDIRAKVLSRIQGGSIVLMHLGGFNTLEALPGMVKGIKDRGLTPVTLAEMLGR
jgi:peptidoglycan/xylan/chitin deacetylase (PgdA/CDA1 family)